LQIKNKKSYNLHRILRAISLNVLGSKLPASETASSDETFVPAGKLMQAFSRYPSILRNTFELMDQCSLEMDFGVDKNKKFFTASVEDDRILLNKLAIEGLHDRYGKNNVEAKQRVEKELKVINDLGFNAYFLIAHDVIRYAISRGFFYVGRGSGANSIVAYCLRITDVDPIELDLYFERFLNPHRTSPPDFDIDFSHRDRDEIIDYIFKRYGKDHVALLGMHTTFKYKAAVRELGKVFGLPKTEIDSIASGKFSMQDPIHQQILRYGKLLQGFPKNHSIHPGGMLISEKPIFHYTSLTMPPKGFTTTHIDMFIAEDVGLYKLDILSQRGLGHIKEAMELVKQHRGIDVDIHNISRIKKDPRVAAKIKAADSIGCFYIESPSMRQVLKKLECDDYLTLVAASSIIRPGVGESGMMQQYIYRYRHPDKFEYLHPKMEELLKETYGVMIYQEDVIKIAHHFGGLDMGEADILRRAMSGKYRGNKEMLRLETIFFQNCAERGYPEQISKEVWRQISSFAGYSFSKAHSASFAVESYQSLYLKTYFPAEFMVAVINNFGGFYSTELYFHELKRTGVRVELPCVNHSTYYTDFCNGVVYMGLVHIQGLETATTDTLLSERALHGPYTSLENFMTRTAITPEQANILIKVGALRFCGHSKKALLWQANLLKKSYSVPTGEALFEDPPVAFELPEFPLRPIEDMYQQIQLLGFPVADVFEMVDDHPSNYPAASDLPSLLGKPVTMLGYLVTWKDTVTKKGGPKHMFFGTFMDRTGNWLDTVHFPESAQRYPLHGRGFYRLFGTVIAEFGVYSIAVDKLEKVGFKPMK
jgi:error-prone DNA polymerase